MENQEDLLIKSRAEYIKFARESCTRNLRTNNTMKGNNPYKELQREQMNDFALPTFRYKVLLIKIVCCCLIFLSIFMIDKFDITISNFSVNTIKEYISSNAGIEEAQNFFVSIYEKIVKK